MKFSRLGWRMTRFTLPSAVLLFLGCDLHTYTPDASALPDSSQSTSAFFVESSEIEGVFGNSDVLSDVFQYVTATESADVFWNALDKQAEERGWTRIGDSDSRRFVRADAPVSPQHPWWICEARVSLEPRSRVVRVGWVSASVRAKAPKAELPELERGFAERKVWPLLKKPPAE